MVRVQDVCAFYKREAFRECVKYLKPSVESLVSCLSAEEGLLVEFLNVVGNYCEYETAKNTPYDQFYLA